MPSLILVLMSLEGAKSWWDLHAVVMGSLNSVEQLFNHSMAYGQL